MDAQKAAEETILGMLPQDFRKLAEKVSVSATRHEIEAHRVYDSENGDRHSYFEDFFKIWVEKQLDSNQTELSALKERLREAVEVIGYYADRKSWSHYADDTSAKIVIDEDDEDGEKVLFEDEEIEGNPAGGKRARAYFAKHKETEG